MNWMGGARSRVKYQGERRIQQEFFERQKLAAAQSFSSKTPVKKKKGLSQDLVALHTVSRVHSGFPNDRKRPIKKVDLEKFHSCTRQIDEVDMGPCSPTQTPSKLFLNDGKLDKKSSFMKSTMNADLNTSRELFPKPEYIHRYSCKDTTDSKQKEQRFKESTKTPMITVENKDKNFVAQNRPNEFIFSKPKTNCLYTKNGDKVKFDPFVSEDFQITPLVRYAKKRSQENLKLEMCKKKKHSEEANVGKNKISDIKNHCFKEPYFSSTPITDLHGMKSDINKNWESFGSISPIITDKAFTKDVENGFRFKPRPMIITPNKNHDQVEGNEFIAGNDVQASRQGNFDSDKRRSMSQYANENLSELNFQRETYKHSQDVPSRMSSSLNYHRKQGSTTCNALNSNSTEFNSNSTEVNTLSKYDLKENLNDSSLFENNLVEGAQKEITGSLAKYRNILRLKNDHESPFLNSNKKFVQEKERNNNNAVENRFEERISKPHFTDLEEEFQYKPMKKGSVKVLDEVMNLYKQPDQWTDSFDSDSIDKGVSDTTKAASGRLSGDSIQNIASPVPGDEFPKHLLLSPSEQLQGVIDQKLYKIASDERKMGQVTDVSRHSGSSLEENRSYRQMKTEMDDVLNELKQLEDQDSASPGVSQTNVQKSTIIENPGAVTTESFEADAYLESEDLLLNDDFKYMQDMEEQTNKQTSLATEKNLNIANSKEENEKGNCFTDEKDAENYNNIKTDKDFERELGTEVYIEKNSEEFSYNCKTEAENSESAKSINQNSMNHIDTMKYEKINENKSELLRDTDDSVKSNLDKSNSLNVSNRNIANENGDNDKSDCRLDTTEDTGMPKINTRYLEKTISIVGVEQDVDGRNLSQLQVPEISSGKNQFTQTDAEASVKKSFVEVATSPFLELNSQHELTDTGVQCDLALFPTLSSLAGMSFKVKPVRNSSLSIHKDEKEKDKPSLS